jgi:arylsulfatase A-like enzyme
VLDQKLIENGVKGGYTDAPGTPTASMLSEIEFADGAIGQMVAALKSRNLMESTTIIITAKHGQSPIDTNPFPRFPARRQPTARRRVFLNAMAQAKQGMVLGVDKNTYVEPTIWTIEWAQHFYNYPISRSN